MLLVGGLYCKPRVEIPKLGSGHKAGLVLAGGKQVQPGHWQCSAGGSPWTAWRGGWVGQSGGGAEFVLEPCYAAAMETKPPRVMRLRGLPGAIARLQRNLAAH